jgi:hypothetical protein
MEIKHKPPKNEVNTIIKCLAGIVNMANKYGYEATSNMMQRVIVTEKSVVRKKLLYIITDEICRKYMITPNELRFGKRYSYDIPRWIAYNMMFQYADMTIKEISIYFEKSYVWINKKIKDFAKLDFNNVVDKKIIDVHDTIYTNVLERIAKIEVKDNLQTELKETPIQDKDEF